MEKPRLSKHIKKQYRSSAYINKFVSRRVGAAIWDYRMIRDKDRILLAVSGGEDSLVLFKVLHDRLSFVPINYQLRVFCIDNGLNSGHIPIIKDFIESYNVDIDIVEQKVGVLQAEQKNCFWCAWNRRRIIFEHAKRLGIKKVALGHHLDDVAETILMNLFFNAQVSGMKPIQEFFKGKMHIIRPLVYLKKYQIHRYAKKNDLPFIKINCPQASSNKRVYINNLLKDLEKKVPHVRKNIYTALTSINQDYLLNPFRAAPFYSDKGFSERLKDLIKI